ADRRRQTVLDSWRRARQLERIESRVHETSLAAAQSAQSQYGACTRLVGAHRAGGRALRFLDRGWIDPRCAASRPEARNSVVRQLEEQYVDLRACVGQARSGPLPARADRERR